MKVAELYAILKMNISDYLQKLRQANSAWKNFLRNTTRNTSRINQQTRQMTSGMKDVSRIVQGIFVSKAIYSTLHAISDTTAAVWDFANSMEYAQMAYTNLFGSASTATEFLNVLRDFAATSPFKTQDIEKATRLLKAYGIEAENLMFVARGALTAAAAQGTPEAATQIARALGQIYTKGVLKAEEARQLAEAGIPVYQILADKIGLTSKQLGRLGDQGIEASTAINALIDGINERFGNLLEDSAGTMQGLISTIKDNFQIIGAELIEPFRQNVKAILTDVRNGLQEARKVMATMGVGGLLETYLPKDVVPGIRVIVANLKILGAGLTRIRKLFGILTKEVLKGLVPAFEIITSTLAIIFSVLGDFATILKRNTRAIKILSTALTVGAAAWILWKTAALGALVVKALTVVLNGLQKTIFGISTAITLVMKHPIVGILTVLSAVLVGVAMNSERVRDSMNKLFSSIAQFGNINVDKLLLPSQKERAADLEKFNKKLSGTSKSMKELGKSTKATKKDLASFDEVFRISATETGISTPTDDIIAGLQKGTDLDNLMPTETEFSEFGKSFIENLLGALGKYKENLLTAGLGAIIGGALGGLIGGPAGAKIGMVLGSVAGWIWTNLADKLGLSPTQALSMEIGGGLGAAIGYVIGGPAGALIGGAIGILIGDIVGLFVDGFKDGDWKYEELGRSIGLGLGGGIGFIIGGPGGALIGAAIGGVVGEIVGLFLDGFLNGDWKTERMSVAIGTGLGAAIGFVVGGPAGAIIGAAIGTLVGWIGGKFIEDFKSDDTTFNTDDLALPIGTTVGLAIGACVGGPAGALIGAGIGTLVGWIATEIGTHWDEISATVKEGMATIGQDMSDGYAARKKANDDFNQKSLKSLKDTWNSAVKHIGKATDDIGEDVSDAYKECKKWGSDTWENAQSTWDNIVATISDSAGSAADSAKQSWQDIKDKVSGDDNDIWSNVQSTWSDIWGTVKKNAGDSWADVETNWSGIWKTISQYGNDMGQDTSSVFSSMYSDISSWGSKMGSSINIDFSGMSDSIWSSMKDAYASVSKGFDDMYDAGADWVGKFYDHTFGKLFDWIDDVADQLSGLFDLADFFGGSSSGSHRSKYHSYGHADGGVFNREHWANFAEGNKAEAIIPLENESAMKPFSDAVAKSITEVIAPIVASADNTSGGTSGGNTVLQVGTLIGDDTSYAKLERKLRQVAQQEDVRRFE